MARDLYIENVNRAVIPRRLAVTRLIECLVQVHSRGEATHQAVFCAVIKLGPRYESAEGTVLIVGIDRVQMVASYKRPRNAHARLESSGRKCKISYLR